jgi:hypothetical protein
MEEHRRNCLFSEECEDCQLDSHKQNDFDGFNLENGVNALQSFYTEDGANAPTNYVEDGANAPEILYAEDGEGAPESPYKEDGASAENAFSSQVKCEANTSVLEDGACAPESRSRVVISEQPNYAGLGEGHSKILTSACDYAYNSSMVEPMDKAQECGSKTEHGTSSKQRRNVKSLNGPVFGESKLLQPSSTSAESEDGMFSTSAISCTAGLYGTALVNQSLSFSSPMTGGTESISSNKFVFLVPGNEMHVHTEKVSLSTPPDPDYRTFPARGSGENNKCHCRQPQHDFSSEKVKAASEKSADGGQLQHHPLHSATTQSNFYDTSFLLEALEESQICLESQVCVGTSQVTRLAQDKNNTIQGIPHQPTTQNSPAAEPCQSLHACITHESTAPQTLEDRDEMVLSHNLVLTDLASSPTAEVVVGTFSTLTANETIHSTIHSLPNVSALNPTNTLKLCCIDACQPFVTETEAVPSEIGDCEVPKGISMYYQTISNMYELVLPPKFALGPFASNTCGALLTALETPSILPQDTIQIHSISTPLQNHTGVPNTQWLCSVNTYQNFIAEAEDVPSESCEYETPGTANMLNISSECTIPGQHFNVSPVTEFCYINARATSQICVGTLQRQNVCVLALIAGEITPVFTEPEIIENRSSHCPPPFAFASLADSTLSQLCEYYATNSFLIFSKTVGEASELVAPSSRFALPRAIADFHLSKLQICAGDENMTD